MSKAINLENCQAVPLYEIDVIISIAPSIEYATVLSEQPGKQHFDEDKKDWVFDDPVGYMLKPKEKV